MSELTISREDAADLGRSIHQVIDELERQGFSRGHIGAAMAGIGIALVQAHQGHETALAVLSSNQDCLTAASVRRS